MRHFFIHTCLLLTCASVATAQPRSRNVLMLNSFERGFAPQDTYAGIIRPALNQGSDEPINFFEASIRPAPFAPSFDDEPVVNYLRSSLAVRLDLVITLGGPAALFAQRHRHELFPGTPLVYGGLDAVWLPQLTTDDAVVVSSAHDVPAIVEAIVGLFPDIARVYAVIGASEIEVGWRREFERQLARFDKRLTFIWLNDLSFTEMLERAAAMPPRSAIFYLVLSMDAKGIAQSEASTLARLRQVSTAPIFGLYDTQLGQGVVGGPMMSVPQMGKRVADTALRILHGESPASIRVPPQKPGPPTFDWRELQRWGIAESRLPAGSVVRYRPPSLWREYRATVLSAVGVLAVQSLLIVGLLYQRRARRSAESENRRNLMLAADASRRQTMSALTSSIAHEIGQPLSAMIHNAQAGRMMINADRATPATMGEILSDIESEAVQATQIIDRHRTMLRSHQLDKKPIDLHAVIDGSLALVAHDLGARQIEATVNLSSNSCIISGDQVLLQQVLVNLVVNAMDAMAETPPARRRVTISTEVRGADVEVSVRDTGTGLPAEISGTLFTPFVTTKAHGLGIGLTITRMIVDAHDGKIDAHNNPEGGARFTVTLPLSETPKILSGRPSAA